MIRKQLVIPTAMAGLLSLFGCNQVDKSPLQPDPKQGQGAVRIELPALPAGYLAKAAAGQKALFALTIEGRGMAPMLRSWTLSPDKQAPVIVAGIPAGDVRYFHGRLIKIDSALGDTSVTHEGSDSAWIQKDSTTDVNLYLRAGGTGKAHVCVQVEGWPADTNCIVPPNPPRYPRIAGCYRLVVAKSGAKPGQDSIFKATLRVDQDDSVVHGVITWSPGQADSARGRIFPDNVAYFGYLGSGRFTFKARVDSTGLLYGPFADSLRGIVGSATATRTACDSLVPPARDSACFVFKQYGDTGKTVTGRLAIRGEGKGAAEVFTHWDTLGAAHAFTRLYMGSMKDTALVVYRFVPPAGMFPKTVKVDSAEYELTLTPNAQSYGKVMKLNPPTKDMATWSGSRTSCRTGDFSL